VSDANEVEPDTAHEEEEDEPHGTLAMMVLFGLLIIAMWVWMYLTLLERG
jgi:hypothetical protein